MFFFDSNARERRLEHKVPAWDELHSRRKERKILERRSAIKNAHTLPLPSQFPNTHVMRRSTNDIPHIKKIILSPKSQKVRKEGVEMWLRGEMKEHSIMRVIDVREDA